MAKVEEFTQDGINQFARTVNGVFIQHINYNTLNKELASLRHRKYKVAAKYQNGRIVGWIASR